jgi:hypothetical protein
MAGAIRWFVGLLLLLSIPCPSQAQAGGKGEKVITIQYDRGDREVSPPRQPLRNVSPPPPPPRAAADRANPYVRPYANERMNSRLPYSLPEGTFEVRWKTPVNPEFGSYFVLQGSDRILLVGGQWKLMSLDGQTIASDRLGGGPLLMDLPLRAFYTFGRAGYFTSRQLADGRQTYMFLPYQGSNYLRNTVVRHGSRLLITGTERSMDPHGRQKAENSALQLMDVGDPPKADGMGFLSTGHSVDTLLISSLGVRVVTAGNLIIGAANHEMYVIDWNMNVKLVLVGDFEPQALSVDETDRIYMTAVSGGHSQLWSLDAAGLCYYRFDFPGSLEGSITPAAIGYDHTAYVIVGGHIYAISPDGKERWSKPVIRAAGATITADDLLLVSEGDEIAVYDGTGARRKVLSVPGEAWTTPPVLTEAGDLLVASKSNLYSFQIKK